MKLPKTIDQMMSGDLGDDLGYVEWVVKFHQTRAGMSRRDAGASTSEAVKMAKLASAIGDDAIAEEIQARLDALKTPKAKTSSPAEEPAAPPAKKTSSKPPSSPAKKTSSKPPVAPAPTIH